MITMPTWVFLLLLVGLVAWNVYLMWANNTQREDNRRLVHRIQTHVKAEGGTVADLSRIMGGGR